MNTLKKIVVVGGGLGTALAASAQTNTISGVTTELTNGLGSGLDVGIGIGVIATGIGLVVFLIRKGVHLRG